MNVYLKFIFSILFVQAIGIAGSFFTFTSISDWYPALNKPGFTPPNWIFGPVWTILYLLMGISLFLVWKKGIKNEKVSSALTLFFIQLALNFLWSVIFFGLKMPGLAFFEIVILWIAILIVILKFLKLNKTAAYLLIPYFVWVSFASVLNLFIFLLN